MGLGGVGDAGDLQLVLEDLRLQEGLCVCVCVCVYVCVCVCVRACVLW